MSNEEIWALHTRSRFGQKPLFRFTPMLLSKVQIILPPHSGAKFKIYDQKYLNYSFRCKKKYEVKFFEIGGGGCGKSSTL